MADGLAMGATLQLDTKVIGKTRMVPYVLISKPAGYDK